MESAAKGGTRQGPGIHLEVWENPSVSRARAPLPNRGKSFWGQNSHVKRGSGILMTTRAKLCLICAISCNPVSMFRVEANGILASSQDNPVPQLNGLHDVVPLPHFGPFALLAAQLAHKQDLLACHQTLRDKPDGPGSVGLVSSCSKWRKYAFRLLLSFKARAG